MNKRFDIDYDKSSRLSAKLQRFARLLQLDSPDAVIQQEIATIQKELTDDSEIVTVRVTVESK